MPGLLYEEFEIGRLFRHEIRRTVTDMDNVLFSSLTHNPQPLHIDYHFVATRTEWPKPLVNSLFTLGVAVYKKSVDPPNGLALMVGTRYQHDTVGLQALLHSPCKSALRLAPLVDQHPT